jgi:hypothetical protein
MQQQMRGDSNRCRFFSQVIFNGEITTLTSEHFLTGIPLAIDRQGIKWTVSDELFF